MRVALIGLPNCGKSTLFNQVAGYKAETGNFSGTTVTFTESRVRVQGQVIDLVDLPGTYTLESGSPAEMEAVKYLNSREVDVIVNVVDSTQLASALSLTLELTALNKPMILAMNMVDEAARLGLQIDADGFSKTLDLPVLPLVASKGRGVKGLFLKALELGKAGGPVLHPYLVDPAERHTAAVSLARQHVHQGERNIIWRDRLDDVLLHPLWGYVIMLLVLFLFFQAVYGIGKVTEPPLLALFNTLTQSMLTPFSVGSFLSQMVLGIFQGITAGVAIVLPYLLPFLLGLGVLEDIGYLPRVAFLMDAFMHRIGLHGKAIVPFILGYGCNVPAVMSTRTLEEPRDRYIAAALAVLVPCAARLAVVFGLVAFYMGPIIAFVLFLLNLFIIALTGRILSKLMPEDTPGLIMEMPSYRVPALRNVLGKSWFRIREFVVEAWPVLIAGSAVLAALNYFNVAYFFNWLVRPITWLIGLPPEVGVPLIFGILRKELSLVMLSQALGTADFNLALSAGQMLVYATFVMFYLPCLATLSVLRRELGSRDMLTISALTVVVALLASLLIRGGAALLL